MLKPSWERNNGIRNAIGGGAGGGPVAPILTAFVADKTNPGSRTTIYSILMIVSIASATAGSSTSAFFEKYVADYYTILFSLAPFNLLSL